jgi:hypothetical protein
LDERPRPSFHYKSIRVQVTAGDSSLQVAQKQRQRQKHVLLTQQQNTHPVDRQKKQEKYITEKLLAA